MKTFEQQYGSVHNTVYVDWTPGMEDALNFCFDVSTVDGIFPVGTTGADALPALEAALARCRANPSTIEGFAPPGTSGYLVRYNTTNGLTVLRNGARDHSTSTIEGAFPV